MHGDFSRSTHRPDEGYVAVVSQQGRVLLDAENNEQATLTTIAERALAADVIGRHGGPAEGFTITYVAATDTEKATLKIASGRYYIDGIPVDATRPTPLTPVPDETDEQGEAEVPPEPGEWTYWDQPYAFRDLENDDDNLPAVPFLVYLRLHDRLVTAVQDPEIVETALGSALPDTTGRIRTDWAVLALTAGELEIGEGGWEGAFDEWVEDQQSRSRKMAARAQRPARVEDDPCLVAPDARYRGPENQYYRVEIHRGSSDSGSVKPPTFKWSRDNGSVVFPIVSISGVWVTLTALGRDDKLDLGVGMFVEVSDDGYIGRGVHGALLQVVEIDTAGRRVRLSEEPNPNVGRLSARHPFLRRWDHTESRRRGTPAMDDGAVTVKEGEWLDMESGVQVYFQPGGSYVPGDYWQFAARTISGEVEWPHDAAGRALLAGPDGVSYHYAPLAIVTGENADPLRKTFPNLVSLGE